MQPIAFWLSRSTKICGVTVSRPCGFPFLRRDNRRIGQFGMELVVDLLARQLGRDHALGGVGQLVVREMPRRFGHCHGERGL